jgi:hypothetical protein
MLHIVQHIVQQGKVVGLEVFAATPLSLCASLANLLAATAILRMCLNAKSDQRLDASIQRKSLMRFIALSRNVCELVGLARCGGAEAPK